MKYIFNITLCLCVLISFNIHAQEQVVVSSTATGTAIGSTTAVSTTFSQIKKSVYKNLKLKVPYFKQEYENSCEAGSLRMALAYKGIKTNDIQLLKKFTYNPRSKDWVNNIWDDPQKQYVGYVDVTGKPDGGYGVYGLPVVKAIKSFSKDAIYATGTSITASFLAEAIDTDNPVLIWGYTSITDPAYTWTTSEGVIVTAIRGEHVRTVVGYKGTVENPVGFYVHDPFFNGKQYEYWPTKKLIDHIQKVPGVTDQAVVVR